MRKESKKYIKSIFLAVLTAMLLVSCGGGGGGGGGMVSFSNNSELHNGGDAGGWGGSGGGINNGSNSNSEVELIITGSTPLNVTGYIYNGTTYPDAASLLNVLSTSTLPDSFTVDFTVANDDGETETREARVSANGTAGNGQDIFIEHQYKAEIATTDSQGAEIYFYKRDGISLASFTTNSATGTGGVSFDQIGWTDGNGIYPTDGALPYPAGQNGDIAISGLAPAYDKMKVSDGILAFYPSMVKNGDSFKIPAGVTVNGIYLPPNPNPPQKLISLDLSDAVLPASIDTTFLPGNWSALKEIKLPNTGINELGVSAFDSCDNLTSVNIPSSVTTIGDKAFLGCKSLANITIPPSVTTIGTSAFSECETLEEIIIPDGVTTIKINTFKSCYNLKSVTIPSSLTTIEYQAFQYCRNFKGFGNDTSLRLPSTLTSVGHDAFDGCEAITEVHLNFDTSVLGTGAFKDCTNLNSIIGGTGKPFTLDPDVFSGCTGINYLNLSSCSYVTLMSQVIAGATDRVSIDLGWIDTDNPKTVTLMQNETDTFAHTPRININGNSISTQMQNTFAAPATWGGKNVIIKPVHGSNFFQWNGTGTTPTNLGSTAPAEWND